MITPKPPDATLKLHVSDSQSILYGVFMNADVAFVLYRTYSEFIVSHINVFHNFASILILQTYTRNSAQNWSSLQEVNSVSIK